MGLKITLVNRNQGKQIKKEVKETSKYPVLAEGTLIARQKARGATQPAQQKNDKRIKKLKNKDSMAPQPGKAAKVLDPPPEFIAERLALWDRLKAEQDATLAAKVPEDITVTLPDGKEIPGQSWRTTPYEVAKGISQGLADNSVVAKVNGEVWDLDRPLENSCSLALIKFDDDEGQAVFWQSSVHIFAMDLPLKEDFITICGLMSKKLQTVISK